MKNLLTRQRLQLALIHIAVAMTLVPIQGTLNRVMIKEQAITATLVAFLISLPYLASPIQVAIGSFAERHPIAGRRRSPYILAGLLLCAAGMMFSPFAAFLLAENWWAGVGLSLLTFGAWGMGFNFATVSYFALATELSGAKQRSRTVAVMFFMMIVSVIVTSVGLSRMLEPYSPAGLVRAFWVVGGVALGLGLLGLLGLEPRARAGLAAPVERAAWPELFGALAANRQARLFFIYLVLMLTAILGHDILLEPFAAQAFGMTVQQTTRITGVWGVCLLACLVVAGVLEGRVRRNTIIQLGSWGAAAAFATIVASGLLASAGVFYLGVCLLGLATGLATVSNLSLMLDMTTATRVGVFIGAWGMADAFARLAGNMASGLVRDTVTHLAQNALAGYLAVFGLLAALLVISLVLLRSIDVNAFRSQAEPATLVERVALAGEF